MISLNLKPTPTPEQLKVYEERARRAQEEAFAEERLREAQCAVQLVRQILTASSGPGIEDWRAGAAFELRNLSCVVAAFEELRRTAGQPESARTSGSTDAVFELSRQVIALGESMVHSVDRERTSSELEHAAARLDASERTLEDLRARIASRGLSVS